MVNNIGTSTTTSPTLEETRWNNGIDTNNTTATDLNSFMLWRIDVYKQKKWKDADLSEYYRKTSTISRGSTLNNVTKIPSEIYVTTFDNMVFMFAKDADARSRKNFILQWKPS
jgi:hypothetical protein